MAEIIKAQAGCAARLDGKGRQYEWAEGSPQVVQATNTTTTLGIDGVRNNGSVVLTGAKANNGGSITDCIVTKLTGPSIQASGSSGTGTIANLVVTNMVATSSPYPLVIGPVNGTMTIAASNVIASGMSG